MMSNISFHLLFFFFLSSFHLSIFFKLPIFQQGTLTQAAGTSLIIVALLEIKKKCGDNLNIHLPGEWGS